MAVRRCDECKPHAFQDEKYGNKMRVMTECKTNSKTASDGKIVGYVCTVCGRRFNESGDVAA